MPNPSATHGEFISRLLSALVLAVLALAASWAGALPFLILVALCAAVLAWEWTQMGRKGGSMLETAVICGVAVAAAVAALAGYAPVGGVIVAAGVLAGLALGRVRAAAGIACIGLPATAVMALRADPTHGLLALIFLLLVVWCTDIMAYVVGRAVGGPKLAPAISPGKTWSGCAGGLVFPMAMGYLFAIWTGGTSVLALSLLAGVLALATQAGDLAESALKRSAGVKDAGTLIPGHGGLLDRLDGFLLAATVAGLVALLRDPAGPGRALLIWP